MADNITVDNGLLTDYEIKTSQQGTTHIQHMRLDLEAVYNTEVDDAGTYTYVGWATPGTATSSASWRIMRVTNATGSKKWAGGDGAFDKIWDNRTSLTY